MTDGFLEKERKDELFKRFDFFDKIRNKTKTKTETKKQNKQETTIFLK